MNRVMAAAVRAAASVVVLVIVSLRKKVGYREINAICAGIVQITTTS
jgi:hypothetical protein